MFNKSGEKIKGLSYVLFLFGIIAAMIEGAAYGSESESFLLGILIAALLVLASWISALLLYALGNVVDDIENIREGLYTLVMKNKQEEASPAQVDPAGRDDSSKTE